MSFLDTKLPLILLHRNLVSLPDSSRYDIMLSPQFYTVKREELPVKYAFQAKKLAPSILDELVGDDEMTYESFRDGDDWVFIAYDLQKLIEFLESKGGSIDKVGNIYFAEQSKEKFELPVELNERETLMTVNDTVTVVPKQLLENTGNLAPFSALFKPETSFRVQRSYSSFISNKQAIVLATIFGLLGLAYFAEGYRYHRAIKASDNKLEKLLNENPSLRGKYARDSIYKKYNTVNKQQRTIRDNIKAISRLTSKKTKLNSYLVDLKGYKLSLDVSEDPKTNKSLRTLAKSSGLANITLKSGKFESSGRFE